MDKKDQGVKPVTVCLVCLTPTLLIQLVTDWINTHPILLARGEALKYNIVSRRDRGFFSEIHPKQVFSPQARVHHVL